MFFYLMFLNIYYWEKLMFSKLVRKENLKKCTSFEEQKGTRYILENIYFGITTFSCLSSTKLCLRFLLNCFVWEITHSLTHWSNLFENFFWLFIWQLMNAIPTKNCSILLQNNSNSQPGYTRFYLPVSTTLTLLLEIPSSICLDPTLWPAWLGKTCQKAKLLPV